MVVVGGGGLGRGEHAAGVVALRVKVERLSQELARLRDHLGGRGLDRKRQLVVDELGCARDEVKRPVLVGLGQRVALLAVAVAKVHDRPGGAERVACTERSRKSQAEALEVLVVWIERHAPSLLVPPMVTSARRIGPGTARRGVG